MRRQETNSELQLITKIKNGEVVTDIDWIDISIYSLIHSKSFENSLPEIKEEILITIIQKQSTIYVDFWMDIFKLKLPLDILKDILLTAIQKDISIIRYVEKGAGILSSEMEEAFLIDFYIAALEKSDLAKQHIPFALVNTWSAEAINKFYVYAISKDALLFKKVPFNKLSSQMIKEIFLVAIKHNAEMVFQYILRKLPFEKYKLSYEIKKEICIALANRGQPILNHITFDKYNPSPDIFITSAFKRNQNGPNHFVTVDEAQKNPNYWAIVSNIFKNQAAAIIQNKILKYNEINKTKESLPKNTSPKKTYVPLTLPTGSLLSVNELFQETHNIEAINQIVDLINNNQWDQLNFQEEHFKLKIWEAFRLGQLTEKLALTALLLYDASHCFNEGKPIVQHSFYNEEGKETKGPYDVGQITYATESTIEKFKENCNQLNKNEQVYFSIDFSITNEIAFLSAGLSKGLHLHNAVFLEGLRLFIKRHDKTGLFNEDDLNWKTQIALWPIMNFLSNISPSNTLSFDQNFEFYVALLKVNEQLPSFALSSNYNENDHDSPIFCQILPTVSAIEALSLSLHGKDYIQYQATVGEISTRQMTDTALINQRIGELEYPGIDRLKNPHEYENVSAFLLSWHDIYFHCWRNSANIFKDLIKYIINTIKFEKKCPNNKKIWALTDLDSNVGRQVRQEMVKTQKDAIEPYQFYILCEYLSNDGKDNNLEESDFFKKTVQNDSHLLLIVDMIRNQNNWKERLGRTPTEIFLNVNKETYHHEFINKFGFFLKIYNKFIDIINRFENQSIKFYILAYRLFNQCEKNQETAIQDLLERLKEVDLDDVLAWKINDGLYFKNDNKKIEIKDMPLVDLLDRLESSIKNVKETISESQNKQTKSQSAMELFPMPPHSTVQDEPQVREKIMSDTRREKVVVLNFALDDETLSEKLIHKLYHFAKNLSSFKDAKTYNIVGLCKMISNGPTYLNELLEKENNNTHLTSDEKKDLDTYKAIIEAIESADTVILMGHCSEGEEHLSYGDAKIRASHMIHFFPNNIQNKHIDIVGCESIGFADALARHFLENMQNKEKNFNCNGTTLSSRKDKVIPIPNGTKLYFKKTDMGLLKIFKTDKNYRRDFLIKNDQIYRQDISGEKDKKTFQNEVNQYRQSIIDTNIVSDVIDYFSLDEFQISQILEVVSKDEIMLQLSNIANAL